jgi:hypothetical protein
MHLDSVGTLAIHEDIDEWLVSEPVAVQYFDGARLRFIFVGVSDDPAPADFDAAVRSFMGLGLADRSRAAPFVYKNYRDVVEAVGADQVGIEIASQADVWAHVRPSVVFVARRHRRDKRVYVQVTAECDWEAEHGLQIIYREGKNLSRVSDQDGHLTHTDAYDLPENEDRVC